jgi:hypothetical protein
VRSSKQASSRLRSSRLRAVPWAVLARAGVVVGRRFQSLSSKERARLAKIVRGSGGRLSNLSPKERSELRKLVSKLDLKGAGRELMPLLRGRSSRGKRR